MYRMVKSAETVEGGLANKEYKVIVNFGGYIGCDNDYDVVAADEDSAIEAAIEDAKGDLTVEDVNQIDDDEWEVTIGFCGFIGCEETYQVSGDDEDEAADNALEEAVWDLSGEVEDEPEDELEEEE